MAVVRGRSPWQWRSSGRTVYGCGRVMGWYSSREPNGWRVQPVSSTHSGRGRCTYGRRLLSPDQTLSVLIAGDPLEEQLISYCLHKRLVEATELHEGPIGEPALVLEEHERQMQCPIQAYPSTISVSHLWAERGIRWSG